VRAGDNVGDVIIEGRNWWQWTNGTVGSVCSVGWDQKMPTIRCADFVGNYGGGERWGKWCFSFGWRLRVINKLRPYLLPDLLKKSLPSLYSLLTDKLKNNSGKNCIRKLGMQQD
jgi:hypothetical protein